MREKDLIDNIEQHLYEDFPIEEEITLEDDQDFHDYFGYLSYIEEGMEMDADDAWIGEAEYQGRTVKLNKPMRGDVKKFKVYVKDPKTGNVKKGNFGARHNCDNPGPKTKARYWSCRKW